MGCEPGGSFVCGGPNVGTCGCDRIANWLATNVPALPLDPAVVASGCSVGMQAAQNLVQEQLNRLVFNGVDNGYLSMRMELEVVDNDLNLRGDVEERRLVAFSSVIPLALSSPLTFVHDSMQSVASRTKTAKAALSVVLRLRRSTPAKRISRARHL